MMIGVRVLCLCCSLYKIFPAMVPEDISNDDYFSKLDVEPGLGRDANTQALYQLAALGVTLGISLVGGAITGRSLLLWCLISASR